MYLDFLFFVPDLVLEQSALDAVEFDKLAVAASAAPVAKAEVASTDGSHVCFLSRRFLEHDDAVEDEEDIVTPFRLLP